MTNAGVRIEQYPASCRIPLHILRNEKADQLAMALAVKMD